MLAGDVVLLAPVSGMRALSGSATCQGRTWRDKSIFGANPLSRRPGRWMLYWEAKQLPRSGRTVVRRRPCCPRLGQPVWSGCCPVVGWTICFSRNLARPAPGCSSGVRTGTACGRPSLCGLGAGGIFDHVMTYGALAQP